MKKKKKKHRFSIVCAVLGVWIAISMAVTVAVVDASEIGGSRGKDYISFDPPTESNICAVFSEAQWQMKIRKLLQQQKEQ